MRDVVEESSLEPLAQPSAARQRAVLLAHVEARLERRRRNRLWSLVAMALVLASVIAFVSWTSAQTPQAALAQYSAHVIDYLPPTDAAVITVRTVVGPGDVVSGSAAETPGHVRVSVQATCSGRGPGTRVGPSSRWSSLSGNRWVTGPSWTPTAAGPSASTRSGVEAREAISAAARSAARGAKRCNRVRRW